MKQETENSRENQYNQNLYKPVSSLIRKKREDTNDIYQN